MSESKKATVTIMTKEEVENRYADEPWTEEAKRAMSIAEMGGDFCIVSIEDEDFCKGGEYPGHVAYCCQCDLKNEFPEPEYALVRLLNVIDKRELSKNRVIISCLIMKP